MDLEDYNFFYYPLKGKIVTNTILNCLSDNNVYVNWLALDFIISHMPINSDINTSDINITLVEAVLQLITKKDFACLKKFSTWLLSHLDDEDEEDVDLVKLRADPSILAINPALQRIFSKRYETEKEAIKPITIMQILLNENSMITDAIMEELTIFIIYYLKDYY